MKLSRISLLPLLLAAAVAASGCGAINRVLAKNALNEGARAYREGNFALAEEKFRYAYELDPSQERTPLFIARAVQQQYKPGVNTPENEAKGRAAIQAYQDILDRDPANDDAYKAIVFLYGQMKNDDKVRQMLTERASLATIPNDKRAEALTILASRQGKCSYDITEQKENKEQKNTTEGGQTKIVYAYKKPANQADFDTARRCVEEGLKLSNQAVQLDPNSSGAWSAHASLLREATKIAEMEGNAQAKTQNEQQYQEALAKAKRLTEEAERKKEAEAAQSPTPAAS
jgi:tetratricopeptide (TPR) repeat protein